MLATINTLWIGKLTRLEKVCLSSFLFHGHQVNVYSYQDLEGLPEGIKQKDANEIIPESEIFYYGRSARKGRGSVAGFANRFRYELLKNSANSYWVDTDVLALKPFSLNAELDFGWESNKLINNAVIGTKSPNHELFNTLSNACESPFKIQPWDNVKVKYKKVRAKLHKNSTEFMPWGLTGPKALTGAVKELKLQHLTSPYYTYYPVSYANASLIFESSKQLVIPDEAKSIHLWNEVLRRDGIDKDNKFKSDSIYEKWATKLGY
ncbi:hypothetical protein V6D52_08920 [Idiomarina loihiensis]|uniref:hypothetical protein n=1 Tax=Idiomarina TaxID=135575 RepID=UPI000E909767|nr:hypothetical protein [Idiomarina loihiensis]